LADTLKNWEGNSDRSIFKALKDKVVKPAPMKERLSYAIYRLKTQMEALEQSGSKMQYQYDKLFRKCTDAVMNKDMERAKIYANECVQIKKMVSIVLQSQFAIEQVTMRLETLEEFGDVAVGMGPVANVIASLKGQLVGVMPEVSYTLGEIGESLNELVFESGEATAQPTNIEASSEAAKILNEAATVAEQKMKERFPTLPGTPASEVEKTSESRFAT